MALEILYDLFFPVEIVTIFVLQKLCWNRSIRRGNWFWRIKAMTATNLSAGSKSVAESLLSPAVLSQSTRAILIGMFTTNGIWLKICSWSLKTIVALLPDMRKAHPLFLLLLTSLLLLFGYFDGLHPHSRTFRWYACRPEDFCSFHSYYLAQRHCKKRIHSLDFFDRLTIRWMKRLWFRDGFKTKTRSDSHETGGWHQKEKRKLSGDFFENLSGYTGITSYR